MKMKVVREDQENGLVGLKDALPKRNITLKVMMMMRKRRRRIRMMMMVLG